MKVTAKVFERDYDKFKEEIDYLKVINLMTEVVYSFILLQTLACLTSAIVALIILHRLKKQSKGG